MKPVRFGEMAEELRRSTVQIAAGDLREEGCGSGVVWDSSGLIMTNAHVMHGSFAQIELWDGRRYRAQVESRDDRRDLAALRIEARGLTAAPQGDSAALRPGEMVVAVGNPLGFTGALTTGVVHAVGALRGLGRRSWVQADVRLAPGNSGGPLADSQGRVVGLNTMIIAGGLALAVPSNTVADFLRRGPGISLGVTVRPVRIRGRTIFGIMVLEIAAGSAAEAASLFPGDILIAANGRAFTMADDLSDAIDEASNGSFVLTFLRGSQSARQVTVQLKRSKLAAA